MPKLKVLSGEEVINGLGRFGFVVIKQRGSHVKLQRVLGGLKQTLTIVNHDEMDKGTLKAIYNQASRYILESDLREYFYTDY